MTEIEKLTEQIESLTKNYIPSEATQAILAKKTICPVVAPFAVGKTSLMHEMEEQDPRFRYVRGFTTRPSRNVTEDAYTFREHTAQGLEEIIDQLKRGELVQAVVHPTNRYVYGSDIESYSAPFNTLDVLTGALGSLGRLGFSNIIPIYLVCSTSDWKIRLNESPQSETMSRDQISERWQEAVISLDYGLQHSSDFMWLINRDGKLKESAQRAIQLILGQKNFEPGSLELARSMLAMAKKEL